MTTEAVLTVGLGLCLLLLLIGGPWAMRLDREDRERRPGPRRRGTALDSELPLWFIRPNPERIETALPVAYFEGDVAVTTDMDRFPMNDMTMTFVANKFGRPGMFLTPRVDAPTPNPARDEHVAFPGRDEHVAAQVRCLTCGDPTCRSAHLRWETPR